MKSILYVLLPIVLSLGLQGCSPHPGAGHWQAQKESGSKFSKITVEFEGRAELLAMDTTAENQRCFWGGKSADAIQLQCTQGDDTGLEFIYLFSVDPSQGGAVATLTQGDRQIGTYSRLAR